MAFTNYLREGNFQSLPAVRFLTEFKKNDKLRLIELESDAYHHLLRGLLMRDNLAHTSLTEVNLDDLSYQRVLLYMDHQSMVCWLINGAMTRLHAQLHRQCLYFLDHIKQ